MKFTLVYFLKILNVPLCFHCFVVHISRIQALSDKRRANLDTAKQYYQFLADTEQEERWVAEKLEEVRSTNVGKDLNAALILLKKHDVSVN